MNKVISGSVKEIAFQQVFIDNRHRSTASIDSWPGKLSHIASTYTVLCIRLTEKLLSLIPVLLQ